MAKSNGLVPSLVQFVEHGVVHVAVGGVGVILSSRDGGIGIALVPVELPVGTYAAQVGVACSAVCERACSYELELVLLLALVPRHGDVAFDVALVVLVKSQVDKFFEHIH